MKVYVFDNNGAPLWFRDTQTQFTGATADHPQELFVEIALALDEANRQVRGLLSDRHARFEEWKRQGDGSYSSLNKALRPTASEIEQRDRDDLAKLRQMLRRCVTDEKRQEIEAAIAAKLEEMEERRQATELAAEAARLAGPASERTVRDLAGAIRDFLARMSPGISFPGETVAPQSAPQGLQDWPTAAGAHPSPPRSVCGHTESPVKIA